MDAVTGNGFANKSWAKVNGYFQMSMGGLVQNNMNEQEDPIRLNIDEIDEHHKIRFTVIDSLE